MKWKVALLKYMRRQWDNLFSVAGVGRKRNNGVNFQPRRLQIDIGRSSLAVKTGEALKQISQGSHAGDGFTESQNH